MSDSMLAFVGGIAVGVCLLFIFLITWKGPEDE